MRRTLAVGPSTILLFVVTLLASGSGLVASLPREVHVALATISAVTERSVECVHDRPSDPDGAARTLFTRATAPTISRVQVPSRAGTERARDATALGLERTSLELVAFRVPGVAVETRQDGVASPGQPAPGSRAPPAA
jgi:hypothetical protein